MNRWLSAAEGSSLCEGFADGLVTEVMEGTLDRAARQVVLGHLLHCEACSALLARMRSVVRLVGRGAARLGAHEPADHGVFDTCVLDTCLPLLALLRPRRDVAARAQ